MNPNVDLGKSLVTMVTLFSVEVREVQLTFAGAKIRA
jgi:hypothetical protein